MMTTINQLCLNYFNLYYYFVVRWIIIIMYTLFTYFLFFTFGSPFITLVANNDHNNPSLRPPSRHDRGKKRCNNNWTIQWCCSTQIMVELNSLWLIKFHEYHILLFTVFASLFLLWGHFFFFSFYFLFPFDE